MYRCRLSMLSLWAMLLLSMVAPALASRAPAAVLDPTTYSSASGEWRLSVNPSDPDGQGPGTYQMVRKGIQVWTATHPFTFWRAVVDDDGTAVGYGYTEGPESQKGVFVVAVFAPDGRIQARYETERSASRFLHGDANPTALGLFLDPDDRRVVVRVADEDINVGGESWWIYRVPDGLELSKTSIHSLGRTVAVRAVEDTPLIVVHGWQSKRLRDGVNQVFALVESDGDVVWKVETPVRFPADHNRAEALGKRLWNGEGLPADPVGPRRFATLDLYEAQHVVYEVQAKENAWHVREVRRSAWRAALPPPASVKPAVPIHIPRALGIIELARHEVRDSIHSISSFAINARGQFALVRRDRDDGASIIITDESGEILGQRKFTRHTSAVPVRIASGGNDRWWYTARTEDHLVELWSAGADLAHVRSVAKTRLSAYSSAVCADGETGFVAGDAHGNYTVEPSLSAYFLDGRSKWQINDRDHLMTPDGFTLTSDRRLAVIDGGKLHWFDLNGQHKSTVHLDKLPGGVQYTAGIFADVRGGVIVIDSATDELLKLSPASEFVARIKPRYADGREINIHCGAVDPTGHIWISDGDCLQRLDAQGKADRAIGSPPSPQRLEDIRSLVVDAQNKIYALSGRSSAVHVFDDRGTPLHVCTPATDDFGSKNSDHVAVAGDGSVYIRRPSSSSAGGYLKFAADGRRIGFESAELTNPGSYDEWHFRPGGNERWIQQYDSVALLSSTGDLEAEIERRFDGLWLQVIHSVAVAPSGSAVIASRPATRSILEPPWLTVCDPRGVPNRMADCPTEATTLRRIAFDGDRIVMTEDDEVYLLTLAGRSTTQLKVPFKPKSYLTPFLPPGRQELWLWPDGTTDIHRYSLP